jgi:hypothetical protein
MEASGHMEALEPKETAENVEAAAEEESSHSDWEAGFNTIEDAAAARNVLKMAAFFVMNLKYTGPVSEEVEAAILKKARRTVVKMQTPPEHWAILQATGSISDVDDESEAAFAGSGYANAAANVRTCMRAMKAQGETVTQSRRAEMLAAAIISELNAQGGPVSESFRAEIHAHAADIESEWEARAAAKAAAKSDGDCEDLYAACAAEEPKEAAAEGPKEEPMEAADGGEQNEEAAVADEADDEADYEADYDVDESSD